MPARSDAVNAPGCQRFRLTIAYDGAGYAGWQWQRTGVGVQQRIEEALAALLGTAPRVHGSSRTDAGVHAQGLVAHVDLPASGPRFTGRKLALALNAHLPADVRVLAAARCAPDFHARFWSTGKEYRYFVWNHAALHPLWRHLAWHVPVPLHLPAMRQAAATLVGRHDFRSFAAHHTYPVAHAIRTVTRCGVQRRGSLLTFVLRADGFLYKMCRGIVGTLVQVGQGKIDPAALTDILRQRDRRRAGMTAPARGLVLWRVFYPKPGEPLPLHPRERGNAETDE